MDREYKFLLVTVLLIATVTCASIANNYYTNKNALDNDYCETRVEGLTLWQKCDCIKGG